MRPLVVITSQTRLHNEKNGKADSMNQSKKASENMGNMKSKRSSYAQSGVVPFDVKLDKSNS